MLLWIVILGVAAGFALIRLAPVDVSQWHPLQIEEDSVGNHPGTGRFLAIRATQEDAFSRIDAVARATPRTRVLAGALDEGQITYETRSRVFGFPDYTTVQWKDGRLSIFARLRFGLEDLGVNRARVESWLIAAGIDEPTAAEQQ